MNTLHFKYAVEIEKTRSITQAAENLYMAQPNMSKAIKELENTLGITIFKRTSKGVIPTEQGMKFLEYAKQILIQIDNMEAIHSPQNLQKQKMKISAPRSSYIFAAFSDFTSDFDTSNDIETYFQETNSLQTISDVREQNCDFGIIRYQTENEKYFMDYLIEKDLVSQTIWEFELLAVMSSDLPFINSEELTYSQLCEMCIEIAHGDEKIPYIKSSSMPDNMTKHRKIYVSDRGSKLDLLSVIPHSFALDAPSPKEILESRGLVQKKCSYVGNLFRDVLIFPSNHSLSESEIQFVNKLYEIRNKVAFGEIY